MKSLAITLKQLREKKGMTIEELAKKAGIGKGTVGDIETGRNRSTVKTVNKLSAALELTEDEKNELDSAFLGKKIIKIPNVIIQDMGKNERLQLEKLLSDNSLFFNDEKISDDDKEKLFNALQEVFFTVKLLNKRKK